MSATSKLLYAWYGDDFTGSTDVMETLATFGVEATLFLREPSPEEIPAHAQAIGLAGDARSRTPEWMDANLPRIYGSLARLHPRILHYKTCSTFDSAPHIGNIGRAIEIGHAVLPARYVPIFPAAPHLGRHVAYSSLYAKAGDEIYPIDKHPTMSCHPVTPMREPNLLKHLAAQTTLPIAGLDFWHFSAHEVGECVAKGATGILFDGVDDETIGTPGTLIWEEAQRTPLFAAGSSGLTRALAYAWRSQDLITGGPLPSSSASAGPLLVLSGSCSPITAAQIEHARSNGFATVSLPSDGLDTSIAATLFASLARGQNTLAYTSTGPLPDSTDAAGAQLGIALGKLLRDVVERTTVQRIMLCGGDTSSHAVQQLPITALTFAAPLVAGAPICRATSSVARFDGLELILKGGQVGPPELFSLAAK